MTQSDYIWIRKWGYMMGSTAIYIEGEVIRARNDNAPLSAIYKRVLTDEWITIHDISDLQIKHRLGLYAFHELPIGTRFIYQDSMHCKLMHHTAQCLQGPLKGTVISLAANADVETV